MRILFLASGQFAQPTLRWLATSGHDVPLVITQPARASGRGQRLTRTPAQALAEELGLPTATAQDVNGVEFVERVRSLDVRLGLAIAFGQKLGPALLNTPPAGFINLHASLLPRYRGAAPINWAIVHGESRTGCTVFRIVERMDAGPILAQNETPIGEMETAGELHDRLAELGVQTVRAALAVFEAGAVPAGRPQDEGRRGVAPKLKKTDGYLRFGQPAQRVVAHVHGMTPWPGAAARFQSADGRWEDVLLVRARAAPPGERSMNVASGVVDDRLHIATSDGAVEVVEIKPSSGRLMGWSDYANGRHVAPGDRFVEMAE